MNKKNRNLIALIAGLGVAALWSLPAAAASSWATRGCASLLHTSCPLPAGSELVNPKTVDDGDDGDNDAGDATPVPEPQQPVG